MLIIILNVNLWLIYNIGYNEFGLKYNGMVVYCFVCEFYILYI